jgi:preprotein translocase subunit SecF
MNNNIPFMKFRKIAAIASIVLFSLSVLSLSFKGLSLGLDFSGGTLIEVTYEEAVELEEIRNILIENDFDDSQVVNFGSNSRCPHQGS